MIPHKETLTKILTKLVGYRDMASYFLELVERTNDEKLLAEIFKLIKDEISAMKDSNDKEQMKKYLQEQLKHEKIEADEHKKADEDLEKALQLLF
jgi:hypothetical protein